MMPRPAGRPERARATTVRGPRRAARRPAWRRLPGHLAFPLALLAACQPAAGGPGGAPAAETAADSASTGTLPVSVPSIAIPFLGGRQDSPAARTAPAAKTHPPDTLPILAPAVAGDFPAVALAELADLDPRLSPRAWIAAHPDDAVARGAEPPGAYLDELGGDWCVLARRRFRLPDGRVAIRSAYFFPPPMPDAARLPPVRTAGPALALTPNS
ncbi:MAG: hypothetical protein IRZ00_14980, partial [Gemmatimonadetes bacterium]|nr:hypothetical protein [Gemmatimonadota bacterium]